MNMRIHPKVKEALISGAVVALESTVITHGLPRPQNLELAKGLEQTIQNTGAQPATIGIIQGELVVGLTDDELEYLANTDAEKASLWNLAAIIAQKKDAGTTVATTLTLAHKAGIKTFATGGIGGVHHAMYDESNDLRALANIPMIVVCAGPKSILNVEATKERLETLGIALVGYKSDYLAGFHVSETKHSVPTRADNTDEIADIYHYQHELALKSALLVSNPVSQGLEQEAVTQWIDTANREAREQGLRGKDVTPYLLSRLAELSEGKSVEVNLRLLHENAALAAGIALSLKKDAKALTS